MALSSSSPGAFCNSPSSLSFSMSGRSRSEASPNATKNRFVASLIETCKLNDVEPQAYIADVLDKLVNLWPASRIDELMPWAWAKASAPDRIAA
jgi:hypothetical protein